MRETVIYPSAKNMIAAGEGQIMVELIYASATELANAIRSKEVSSIEVVDAYLQRIERVNPKLNAIVQLNAKTVRNQAEESDVELARGHIKGPLQNLRKHGKTLVAQRHIGIFSKIEGLFQMAYPISYVIGLLSISLTAATHLFLPGNFIESFWLSPTGFLVSFAMLVTFPYICFVCSPIILVLLISVASPLIVAVFIKEKGKDQPFSIVGTVGALLLWNDNILTGTKAAFELLLGRETIWIPTRKTGSISRDGLKNKKVKKRKIGNFILRIVPALLITGAFILISIGNFTLLAFGLLLPALMWLLSAFFILLSND